jgi:hypothetical protein
MIRQQFFDRWDERQGWHSMHYRVLINLPTNFEFRTRWRISLSSWSTIAFTFNCTLRVRKATQQSETPTQLIAKFVYVSHARILQHGGLHRTLTPQFRVSLQSSRGMFCSTFTLCQINATFGAQLCVALKLGHFENSSEIPRRRVSMIMLKIYTHYTQSRRNIL